MTTNLPARETVETEARERLNRRELAMFGRDRITAVSASGIDTVAVYAERTAENERYLAEIAAKLKRAKRKRKGKAA